MNGNRILNWTKSLFINLLVVLVSVIFVFLVFEVYLRFSGYPGSIYRLSRESGLVTLKPDSTFLWKKECFENRVTVNSWGFHAKREYSVRDGDSGRKTGIAVIGDSYVECLQNPWEACFFQILEQKLKERNGDRFEVFSLGISGNGRLQNFLYYRHYGRKLKPEVVIDLFITNDVGDNNEVLRRMKFRQVGGNPHPYYPYVKLDDRGKLDMEFVDAWLQRNRSEVFPFVQKLKSNIVSIHFFAEKFRNFRRNLHLQNLEKTLNGNDTSSAEVDSIPVDYQIYLKEYPAVWKEAWQQEEAVIKEFSETVRQDGGIYILVAGTDGFCVHEELFMQSPLRKEIFDCEKPYKMLEEIARRNHIPFLSLLEEFRKKAHQENEMTVFPCDGHWNQVGHRWAGEAIFEFLERNILHSIKE